MTRLTIALTAVGVSVWAWAAPPRVSGNRPVSISIPVPDAPPVEVAQQDEPPPGEAAEPATKSRSTRPSGQKRLAAELKKAREKLLKCSSVSARLVESVTVLDRSYKAEGRYLQTALKSGDWHMRLELVLKVGEAEGSLLEVCDGQVLWSRTEVELARRAGRRSDPKEQTVTRRNVAEILSAAQKLEDSEQIEKDLIISLGLGGLPALLAALERDMKFTGMDEQTINDHAVVVLEGTWDEKVASKLRVPAQRGAPGMLPAFVPDVTRVYLDRETGFPHRIVYLKKLPGRDAQRTLLQLDFHDVVLNGPIDPSEFVYTKPQGVKEIELTRAYIDRLAPPDQKGSPKSR